MYAHERSLVKKFGNKPFVILGINSDSARDTLKNVLEKENITWRSWFDGVPNGPIATDWHVQIWPTLYLIDYKGVIRCKSAGSTNMDEFMDKLVEEAENHLTTSTKN